MSLTTIWSQEHHWSQIAHAPARKTRIALPTRPRGSAPSAQVPSVTTLAESSRLTEDALPARPRERRRQPPFPGVTTLTDSRLTEEDAHPVDL
jgi:hypothetical protein